MANLLWQSQGDGSFANVALQAGCAFDDEGVPKAGMGTDSADINNDGWPDLMVGNLRGQSDSLFVNEGAYFLDATARSGLRAKTREFTRFGLGLHDFDNDGHLDIVEVNGRVMKQAHRHDDDPYAEPNLVMRGTADGVFEEVEPRGGVERPVVATSRAAAFGDLNNDGGVDVVVTNRDGSAHILLNIITPRGHWISFKVLDAHGRDALGAIVKARVSGDRRIRVVRSAYSYCAANDPRVHFGLGDEESIRGVHVIWPDRSIEDFGNFAADQISVLKQGSGTPVVGTHSNSSHADS
jgi:hypothetical protein